MNDMEGWWQSVKELYATCMAIMKILEYSKY